MHELVPIVLGLGLGAALGYVRPSMRLAVGAVLAVVLGVTATLVTGEFKASWSYVLFDIPLVGLCAVAGLLVGRRVAAAIPGG